MRTHWRTLAIFPVLVAWLSAGVAQDAYPIKLERSFKAGDSFVIAGTATRTQSQKATQDGAELESEASYGRMVFEGRVQVEAVSAAGTAEKATCVVEKCLLATAEGQDPKEALAKGKKLIVTRSDAGVEVAIEGGGEIPPDAKEMIELFLPVHEKDKDANDNDKMFGTTQPRKAGESWSIDAAQAAASLGAAMKGIPIDASKLKGTSTLKGVEDVGGVPCLAISAEITVTDIPVGGPPGFTVTKGEMSATMSGHFPTDLAQRQRDKKATMRFVVSMTGKTQQGQTVVVDTDFSQEQDVTYTPAK